MDDGKTSEAASRAEFLRLMQSWRAEQRAVQAHSQRGKICPIQRPGLKR